jgi:DNA-binding MarR family transcriptional regulator
MPIPDDVRRFVVAHVASVPQLEALLLLKAAPEAWTPARAAARLYLSEAAVAPLLEQLEATGLVAREGPAEQPTWRYAPRTPELDALCARLEDAYARHLVVVTRLIHSRGDRSAQRFADAFKWRKD